MPYIRQRNDAAAGTSLATPARVSVGETKQ